MKIYTDYHFISMPAHDEKEANDFLKALKNVVDQFQENGLEVEIQYSSPCQNRINILILGYKTQCSMINKLKKLLNKKIKKEDQTNVYGLQKRRIADFYNWL